MYRTGFGKLGDWTNHNIEEIISGYYDIPHGAGLSTITPQWMRYVYKKHLPMFVQFAVNVMGIGGQLRDEEETAFAGMIALEDFSRKMGKETKPHYKSARRFAVRSRVAEEKLWELTGDR